MSSFDYFDKVATNDKTYLFHRKEIKSLEELLEVENMRYIVFTFNDLGYQSETMKLFDFFTSLGYYIMTSGHDYFLIDTQEYFIKNYKTLETLFCNGIINDITYRETLFCTVYIMTDNNVILDYMKIINNA